ncbi:hypothetical protein FB192DRAFT_1350453 [Mucor lusitanicus]|uniref:Uncharacterized protein n=1 Tax=Mucor circinelloides f. lusitanicus TaxID=29924 RepID=A0A8H4BPZ4_MUCCL|nr:hypothetical protein FB192DRAFT_1350453 [Mucor lusitanicus]
MTFIFIPPSSLKKQHVTILLLLLYYYCRSSSLYQLSNKIPFFHKIKGLLCNVISTHGLYTDTQAHAATPVHATCHENQFMKYE